MSTVCNCTAKEWRFSYEKRDNKCFNCGKPLISKNPTPHPLAAETFSRYTENENLEEADIFHLYDTGELCIKDSSSYHDSRHFELVAFNSKTREKKNCGRHDGICSYNEDVPLLLARVFIDGSFMLKLTRPARIELFQNVLIS